MQSSYALFDKPSQTITFNYPFICSSNVSFNSSFSVLGDTTLSSNVFVGKNITVANTVYTSAITGLQNTLPINASTTQISNILSVLGPSYFYDKLTVTHPVGTRNNEAISLTSNDGSLTGGIALYHGNDGVLQFNTLGQFNSSFFTGNVGLGVIPQSALHVRASNPPVRIDKDSDTVALKMFRYPTGNFSTPWKGFAIGVNAASSNNGSFVISDYGTSISSATTRLTIDNSGNVGINQTAPAYTLDVAGTANISSNLSAGYFIGRNFQGPIQARQQYYGNSTSLQTQNICQLPDITDKGFYQLIISVQINSITPAVRTVTMMGCFNLFSTYNDLANDATDEDLQLVSKSAYSNFALSSANPTLSTYFNFSLTRVDATHRYIVCKYFTDNADAGSSVCFRTSIRKLDSFTFI